MNEPIGAELDLLVAKKVDIEYVIHKDRPCIEYELDPERFAWDYSLEEWKCWVLYSPSTDWAQGGPLVDEYWDDIVIWLHDYYGKGWERCINLTTITKLEWFMRAIVGMKG